MVPARGVYRDPATGVELPIATAMNAGQIVVDFTTKTRSVEKTEAIGLITIRTLVRTPPLCLSLVTSRQKSWTRLTSQAYDACTSNHTHTHTHTHTHI